MNLILPRSTVDLIGKVTDDHRHPGLQLDKFSVPGNQEAQKVALDRVRSIPGDASLLDALIARRQTTLGSLPGATALRCTTTGLLTLHLSRASALENAGLCLHPLYGFAYLPGSGLKGMARAYAETVWLPTQDDPQNAWRRIEAVFGWAPSSDRGKEWKPGGIPERAEGDTARVGSVVFHDAWPEGWPQLIVDIVNNHHPHYYPGNASKLDSQGRCSDCGFQPDDPNAHPPGDWENPVPVYLLAVKPGTTFILFLAKRRRDVADNLLALARQWLLGALCHLGAGAKTNAGYGAFKPLDDSDPALQTAVSGIWTAATSGDDPKRAAFETTLELVTPAFLAGADQYGGVAAEGCDLRPATLRGHLRWWWRTLHAGFLEVKTLRALEAAIWGDTSTGGAVRIVLRNVTDTKAIQVPGKRIEKNKKNQDVLRLDGEFAKRHELQGAGNKTTQGLLYLSYGMDEMPAGKPNERRQRFCLPPGAKWNLAMSARDGFYLCPHAKPDDAPLRIAASLCMQQARAALWLLCRYGGVGSKSRNGFGSLASIDEGTLDEFKKSAAALRRACAVEDHRQDAPEITTIDDILESGPIPTPWLDYWFALDQLAFSAQAFAQAKEKDWAKEALGLPRKIATSDKDGCVDRRYERVQDKQTKRQVVWLGQRHPHLGNRDAKDMRHAAPIHVHLDQTRAGTYTIRVVAFPCSILPTRDASRNVLKELLAHLKQDLESRIKRFPNRGKRVPSTADARQHHSPVAMPALPQAGDRVDAVLLEEKTKKDGWKARHEPSGLSGPIQNTADVPDDRKPGGKLTLIVASANARDIAFRYPTDADDRRAQRHRRGPEAGQGRRRRGAR